MGERTRGAVLYALAALVLIAGGFWWLRAAPDGSADSRLDRWRQDAMRLLPNSGDQEDGDMIELAANVDHEIESPVAGGVYQVSAVCVGPPDSMVRVSQAGAEDYTGRALVCGQRVATFEVNVAEQLRMSVRAGPAGPLVFRYTVSRQP
jgi:uncharacterized protein DUF6023